MRTIVSTGIGQRKINQDFTLTENIDSETSLMLIADGMGGYSNGEVAAKLVAENILLSLSKTKKIDREHIQESVNQANLAIQNYLAGSNLKMGATVGGVILTDSKAICFWVGDVKIFHFKDSKLVYESNPHSLMNQIIENGSIIDQERVSRYKHVVTRSVQGDTEQSKIDYIELDHIAKKDLILVCSDGVHDIYDGLQIQQILNTSETYDLAVEKMKKRLAIDSKDNYSLILICD